MVELRKAATVLAVLVCLSLAQLGLASECKSKLKKAEARLENEVKSSVNADNFAGLKKYADELRSSRVKRLTSSPKRMDDLIKAKEESELPRQKCDMEQYQLMDSVITSIYGKPLGYTESRECLIRIDTLFDEILGNYLKECRPRHEEGIKEALVTVDAIDVGAVELFSSKFLDDIRESGSYVVSKAGLIFQRTSLWDKKSLELLFSVIEHFSPEAAKNMREKDRKGGKYVAEQLNKYVFSPCHRFLEKLDQATQISQLDHLTDNSVRQEEELGTYRTIFAAHLCRIALKEHKDLPKLLAAHMWAIE